MSVFVLRFFDLLLISIESSFDWLGRDIGTKVDDIINVRMTDNLFSYMWGENRVPVLFPVP